MVESMDEKPEGDSSDESDLSVVKIVSDDPWAAARAAAILKQVCFDSNTHTSPFLSFLQHDWDLVIKEAVLCSWALGPHFSFFLTDMYLYDHMTSTHMTAYLYNRAILSGTSLFPPFVCFLLFSSYGSL